MEATSSDNSNCFPQTLQTILVGSGIILFFLWWNRKREKPYSGPTGDNHDSTAQDISPRKENKFTQTPDSDIKWTGVYVTDQNEDEYKLRHKSELRIDLHTGDVTRSEEVTRLRNNYILTRVG